MVDPSWDGGFSRLAAADMNVLYQPDYLDVSQMCGLTPRSVRDLISRACANQRRARQSIIQPRLERGPGKGKKGCGWLNSPSGGDSSGNQPDL